MRTAAAVISPFLNACEVQKSLTWWTDPHSLLSTARMKQVSMHLHKHTHNCSKVWRYLYNFLFLGEGKANGDSAKTGSSRMITRLRNPDSKLSQRKVMQDKDGSSQDGSRALKEVRLLTLLIVTDDILYRGCWCFDDKRDLLRHESILLYHHIKQIVP